MSKEVTHYFTFGQDHAHRLPKITLDKDIVISITAEDPRAKMFELFGPKWAFEYAKLEDVGVEKYYPRGIYNFNTGEITHERR